MATSRLTGRTLALATVALVLACAKAAIGQPERAVPRQAPATAAPRTGGFVPSAPVRGSNVGTVSAGGGGGSSRVGTITASRGPSGSGIVTVQGDRRMIASRPGQPQARPGQPLARPKTNLALRPSKTSAKTSAAGRPEPRCTVRRIVIGDEARLPAPKEPAPAEAAPAPSDPRLREALQQAAPPPALGRNAFSLGTGTAGQIPPP